MLQGSGWRNMKEKVREIRREKYEKDKYKRKDVKDGVP